MASPAAILQVFVNANTKVASAQLAAFDRQLSTVGKTSAATGVSMGKFTKGAAAAGTGIAAVGVAAAVVGKQLFDLGKEFDDAYDRIRVGTGATGKELEKLKRDFRGVAKNVPDDFAQVGDAIADLNTRLGLTGKPLRQVSIQMLNLSRLTGTDLKANIKAVSRAFVDFEVPVRKQRKSLDGLFRLFQRSGATVEELATSVQRFGSPLRTLGFSFEEAAAMFANFERAGVNTQTMVPGLKLAIGNLVKPTDDFAASMRQLGVDATKPGPALRQIMDLLGPGGNLSNVQKMSLAMQVFGKRAGADMAEAIKQGRFDLDQFLKVFREGDSINKAAKDTNDFSENMRIFGNRLKVLVEPAANAVFNAMSKLSAFLAGPEGRKGIQIVGKAFSLVFKGIRMTVGPVIKAVVNAFRGVRGAVRWIRSIYPPIKKTFNDVKNAIVGTFKSAMSRAKAIFEAGKRAVIGIVNSIITVLNKIPGVSIEGVGGGNYFGEGSSQRGPAAAGLQRGGILRGGNPSGDSIPAMLERGEYVLNREAVKKIGVKRLDKLNFSQAPRFQKGGYIDTLTEFPGTFVRPLADLSTKALEVLMNGPGQFLSMLPKPNLPQPFTGLGPMLIEFAKGFIRANATNPLSDNSWVDSNTFTVARFLASKFGASISSSYRSPAQNAAVGGVPNSSHTRGTPSNPGAFDFVPPSGGMQSFAGKNIAGIVENMIHDVGSGLHNHIAFFQRGGSVGRGSRALRKGKRKGKGPGFYPGKAQIAAFNPKIAALTENIELFEREAGADWSEAGSELGANEIASLVERYLSLKSFYERQRDLIVVAIRFLKEAIKRSAKALKDEKDDKKKRGIKKNLGASRSALSALTGRKQELQGLTGSGGLIGDTVFRLKELGFGVPAAPSPSDSEVAELLRDQLAATQRALAVSQAQIPIFQQFMPRFHQGGIVQGPMGAERPVMAQAGEGIFTRDQMRAMGSQNITVVIEDAAIDSNRIRVEVDGVIQEKVSTVRRQGSNRRFATR